MKESTNQKQQADLVKEHLKELLNPTNASLLGAGRHISAMQYG